MSSMKSSPADTELYSRPTARSLRARQYDVPAHVSDDSVLISGIWRSPAARHFEDWLFFLTCWLRFPANEFGDLSGALMAAQLEWNFFQAQVDAECAQ